MRIIRVGAAALALIGAFAAGHLFATPPAADAQPQFSHFQCYTSLFWKPATNSIPVALHDQFGSSEVVVGKPQFFCLPVMKKLLKTQPHDIKGPADHLACYMTEGGKVVGTARSAENQLGKLLMRDFTPRMLCVPTRKDEKFPLSPS
ncbi:MAG: hypothetical protein M3169_12725 [Candidatus Eremiobacteraeota bacterium]|nr:hypothetical protein [Candidatus Eremiobacteraeota bacterium]